MWVDPFWAIVFLGGAGCLVAGIFQWQQTRQEIRREAESWFWPWVRGRVAFTRVSEIRDFEAPYRFVVNVDIQYEVAGRVHACSFCEPTNSTQQIETLRRDFSPQQAVAVYFSPDNPDICTLEPGHLPQAEHSRYLAAVLWALGLVMIIGSMGIFIS